MSTLLVLFGAGLLAGAMNALAGGGTFVSLPVLIAAGLPSVAANTSSTVALWPGQATGAIAYHSGLRGVCGVGPRGLLVATVLGGAVGGVLLLKTSSASFDVVLPWLLLLATAAMAFGRRIGARLQGRLRRMVPLVLLVQFCLGVYGGFFGGAVGLMMVAAWSLFGETDMRALHGPRMLLVTAANTVAVLAFLVAGAVWWRQAVPVMLGGVLGGVLGACLGRRLPSEAVRLVTIAATAAITVAFFLRAYAR